MSSTQFVVVYASSCVLLHVANLVVWRFAERTTVAADDPPAVDVYELAMLNGGPPLAITTAVTMLHRRGVVGAGPSPGTIAIRGELHVDADPIEREVYDAVRRMGAVAIAALARELADSDALENIRAGLRRGRLLMDAHSIWWGRALWLGGPFVLLVVGVDRLLTTWDGDNDDATTYLLILTLWIALVTMEHVLDGPRYQRRFAGRAPPTALGRSLLTQWRKENPDDIASEEERVAMTIALTDDPKRYNDDPLLASNAIVSRARELARVPAPTSARRPMVGELSDDALPIAEQLLLVGCAEPREQPPDEELGAQLAGAVLTELIVRERVAVRRGGDAGETVAIIDASPTGDDLLDEGLALLGPVRSTRVTGSAVNRVWGIAARGRLRSRGGLIGSRDITLWWRGAWTCAEFPGLAPTVVREILTLYEGLDPLVDRVARQLVDRGALGQRLEGWWPYVVWADEPHRQIRDRVRTAALAPDPQREPRTAYLVAMCAVDSPWLRDAILNDRIERRHASVCARIALGQCAVAPAVKLIVRQYHAANDD
jgi:uncharacterized protein (TIGR04222 family)